ncbi:sugar-specific transcriptional regulator TrmB [Thermovibrio guaymasensis]|uniref:Sugar-specific transcriptional regulator TrmB n=1 Tax=Thermovibrio guaymasensis TaxID=240167 RepID=A0A420W6A2_9BACT|nr:helix-turn-helix domain-containing protein [Thermovibrio guaymasensis]RKQ60637.1 sugar-specific transcriptional regulator TrmB [Thermovibrio guaymasensis]
MEKSEVIDLLKEFGLNTYEAKCYVALLESDGATAPEVAKRSGVPPQRVYDSLSSLEEKGMVQVVNRKPKLFVPLPVREALLNRLYQIKLNFEKREKFLRGLIEEIERKVPVKSSEFPTSEEVFTVEGEKAIVSTAVRLISSAKRSVKIAGIRPLFAFGCRGNLGKYLKEGVELLAVGKFDTPCKEEISRLGGRYLEKEVECTYLLIVDDSKLLFIYSGDRGIFTESRGVVTPFLSYFKELST